MFKPLPTIGVLIGYASLATYALGSSLSKEGEYVADTTSQLVDNVEESEILFGEKASVISELRTLAEEVDSESDTPIDVNTLLNAESIVRALPSQYAVPECSIAPDGTIVFDWIQSRNVMLSLSVGSKNRLAYAWLRGTEKGHGVVNFDGYSIPAPLVIHIPFSENQNASIRA